MPSSAVTPGSSASVVHSTMTISVTSSARWPARGRPSDSGGSASARTRNAERGAERERPDPRGARQGNVRSDHAAPSCHAAAASVEERASRRCATLAAVLSVRAILADENQREGAESSPQEYTWVGVTSTMTESDSDSAASFGYCGYLR